MNHAPTGWFVAPSKFSCFPRDFQGVMNHAPTAWRHDGENFHHHAPTNKSSLSCPFRCRFAYLSILEISKASGLYFLSVIQFLFWLGRWKEKHHGDITSKAYIRFSVGRGQCSQSFCRSGCGSRAEICARAE